MENDRGGLVGTAAGAPPRAGRAKALGKRSFARQAPEVTLDRMHEEYLHARRVENVRHSTLAMYRGALRPWAAWCAAQGVTRVGQVLTRHAEEYLLSLMERGLSERTVRNRAVVIKSALKFAHRRGYLASERLYD